MRPHPHMQLARMAFTPFSPAPSPADTPVGTPTSAPTTLLLSTSPAVPSIIVHPPAGLEAPTTPGRRLRARRLPLPSPHLLCVGWRRRPDHEEHRRSMRARRARAGRSKAESSVLVQRVAGAVATVSEIDVPALVAAGVASLLAAVLPQQDALPLYRSCAPKKGRHPTAVIALMLAFALALFLVIRDMLEAPPSSPFLYEHQYTRIPHPPRVPRHLSAAAYYEQVGVTFPPQRDLVDMLNPWDFH